MLRLGITVTYSALCALLCATACHCREYYVATNGNDSWSGALNQPNKARTDGPFATLDRARDAVRDLKKSQYGLKEPITVYLRKGTYFLDSPFTLSVQDSGTKDAPITYAAASGEDVTISGGKVIEGFREVVANGHKMIAADIPEVKDGKWNFAQLFVNDRRKARTRLPKEGYFHIVSLPEVTKDTIWSTGQSRFVFGDGDITTWRNLADVEVVALHFWVESRMPIKSVDQASHTVELGKNSTFRMTDDYQGAGARYFVENVFEALDSPGEWYLDRPTGTLYYYPAVGEDAKHARFVAPRLERLVVATGDAASGKKLEYVSFTNLRFAHTEYTLPAGKAGDSQAAIGVPGAIYFERASNCCVANCEIAHIGTYAVEVAGGCEGITIDANRMCDMGAGGVKIHQGSGKTTVSNNDIGDGGKIFMSAIGVWIGNSPNNRVVHNHIHDLNYSGVSVGWVWGYGESKAVNNLIEYNHIHHVGRGVLSDLAGIYTLGVSPGTVERNNLIHDCYSHSYGGWGIYTDEGSSNILIENNVVYNTKTGGFHQHYGKENTVRNNIFAFSKVHQIQRTRVEEHTSFTFERNIVYFSEGVLLGNAWADDHFVMDYNVYYDVTGRPINFAGASLEDWRKRGHDTHSLIADPKFANPAKFDFALKPDSPALSLGFKPIDLSDVGPIEDVGPGN